MKNVCSHPLYPTYKGMLSRCNNPNHVAYLNYGGRGIKVCERWSPKLGEPGDGFRAFVEDMGERPDGCSLERVDVDGNYDPRNCKWIPRSEQAKNKRVSFWTDRNKEIAELLRNGVKPREVSRLSGVCLATVYKVRQRIA